MSGLFPNQFTIDTLVDVYMKMGEVEDVEWSLVSEKGSTEIVY